jgi:protein-disulfide isomerase
MTALALWLLCAQLLAPAAAAPREVDPAVPGVEIVLFSDFQCPFCAQLAGAIHQLQQAPPPGVHIRFAHFPLGIHPNAPLAHQAAVAAAGQDKFWEMHDLLFANRSRAQREDVIGYARQLGLDVERFETDLDSDRVKALIDADKAEGSKRGVDATPTFYVNGREFVGARSVAQLKQIIEGERYRKAALTEVTDLALSRGPSDAPVTIEIFADLQSPVSRPALAVVDAAAARYPAGVRVQFRNFPLTFHPHAGLVHEAAMTAAHQGRFWEFVGPLLDHPDAADEAALFALARRIGLDSAAFADALGDHRYAARVTADVEDGERRGVRGSPAVIVSHSGGPYSPADGQRRFDGVPSLQALIASIDAALSTPSTKRP